MLHTNLKHILTAEEHGKFISENEEVGKLLHHMINNPEKY